MLETMRDALSRMAQAMIPTKSAPSSDNAESHKVARKHCRYSGMYSKMILKLKPSSISRTRKSYTLRSMQQGVSRINRLTPDKI